MRAYLHYDNLCNEPTWAVLNELEKKRLVVLGK